MLPSSSNVFAYTQHAVSTLILIYSNITVILNIIIIIIIIMILQDSSDKNNEIENEYGTRIEES